ncbi:nicotinate phosphoribosyltransferase [Acinetobacter baumannii]|jgi:nicotinate phosphoribosyltransferase|uniref:Nicotinate phosphoribosyltransferase n=17 Tax=Acinetobacter baumannii TaxID=470 RepID=PNCB_ACIBT|nr:MULTISPECIES: nicotinate phosphoribosyltransferase [Acinetobacter]A3MA25.2 RecName: Full=Nicotinate phosphoribosyltransferase; Short=NAPRTase [Acinetobacter baumannii ATCC 17978]EMT94776.1 nicotinate phosphoribosyltransferase [Acinetobacter baumannii ABNIH6]EMU09199.1 nicotinate phosphoribosyltransferase [Acinetobacter baumannii ABNIH10]PXA53285.1 nicotinate phosphoribosyltransferase [Acinetobacter baumannii A424]ABO13769.2 nicotinate phosphoribosyltransferase [Acinetobacter baumannii ATCC 
MSPIIHSLLDTDLYKFTMLQVVLHKFPQTHSVYHFRCRNLEDTVYPLVDILDDLNEQLDHLCNLKYKEDELQYLRKLRFIKSDFVDYLELFQLKRRFIHASIDEEGRLDIRIEGPMVQAMMFEIFVLAIVNELYFSRIKTDEVWAEGERRLQAKLELIQQYEKAQQPNDPPFLVSDFGTRRRYSFEWQKHVVAAFHNTVPNVFRGTSNVLLAKELNITPIGTMAHEFLQAFQALDVRLRDFQKAALETWVQEYRGDLGIALTDVVGMDAFLRDFDLYFAKLFDGLRHDSGDPYEWGDKAYAHYRKLKIDTKTKMLTFSDGLNLPKAWELHQYFKDRFQVSFGIGTNLTNDMGQTPLNIVLKLVECNGQSVAKISDSPGKTMTDNDTFLAYLRQVFQIEELDEAI